MSHDEQLLQANWDRMGRDLERAATEFDRTAAALREIPFTDAKGERRAPESIISQAALSMHTAAGADLIHRLAVWAEAINEIQRHQAGAK